jgi:secondary thiamine-phosphate synthase enzyme
VDITDRVQAALEETHPGISGMVYVYVPHTTAAVTINEGADPSVAQDLITGLSRLVPRDAGYRHSEGNSDAHIKTSLVGSNVSVPVQDGRLGLGTWQSIYLAEFDGPRARKVCIVPLESGS